MVVCDGWGKYQFLDIIKNNSYYLLTDNKGQIAHDNLKQVEIGKPFVDIDTSKNLRVLEIVKEKDVEVTFEF